MTGILETMSRREDVHLHAIAAAFQKITAMSDEVRRATEIIVAALRAGNRVFFCGNGGSAADAQHLAAELLGRFLIERDPFAAVALNVNVSAMTAIANDYGYEQVFSRQLRGLGRQGDVLVGISTSGNSANIVAALEAARDMGIATIGLTGASGGAMAPMCDLPIRVPSGDTPRIQEMHIALGHAICEFVESELA